MASRSWLLALLVVQWLGHCAVNAWGSASIPGQGTRSDILQLSFHAAI